MKKRNFVAMVLWLIISCVSVFAVACSQNLSVPIQLGLDESYRLTWSAVDNARSYTVSVTDTAGNSENYYVRNQILSLADLKEGDYEVKVRALGDGNRYRDSDWSETVYFHRDYENGCVYELVNDNEYYVAGAGTSSGVVEIGEEYRGKPVTGIKQAAFRNRSDIEKVILSERITYIGDNAFYNCGKLTAIDIPDSVTYIGSAAFQACYLLTSINIPDGITEISDNMFNYCRSLAEVNLPEVTTIGDYAFANCTALSNFIIPDSVTQIGQYAFSGTTALKEVTIGEKVQSIGEYAFFKATALSDVVFVSNDNLTTIGKYAFIYCESLYDIDLPDSVTQIGVSAFYLSGIYEQAKNADETYVYADNWLVNVVMEKSEDVIEIGEDSFKENVIGIADGTFRFMNLERVYLPSSVKIIGMQAFQSCAALWTLQTNDNSLEVINDAAFYDCSTLRYVRLGAGLLSIGNWAFYNCELLENNTQDPTLLVPDTVKRIGMAAYYGTKLYSEYDEYGVAYAGNWVIGFNTSNYTITLKDTVEGIADYAFAFSSAWEIDGAVRVKNIGTGAFYNCANLSTFNLNRNIRKIEDYTFYGCSNLFKVDLPSRVTAIGRSAFYECTNLSEIDFSGNTLETIGDFAFYDCMNLDNVDLGETLTDIGRYAFYKCSWLEKIVIPDTVQTIGEKAFYKCEKLNELTLGNSLKTIGDYAFSGCTDLSEINIPDSVTTIGNYAFRHCDNVSRITIGDGVETIGNYAFANLINVTELVIPDSVRSIGDFAFKGCYGIKSLVLNGEDAVIGDHAFYGCYDMSIYAKSESENEEWNSTWNSSFRPVIWNCAMSDDGKYVVSVTIGQSSFSNCNESNTIHAPVRLGYIFLGWTTEYGSDKVQYSAEEIGNVPMGTVLYAVWYSQEQPAA